MPATKSKKRVTGGADTHLAFHHAAVTDRVGEVLGTAQFPATFEGYRALLKWMRSFGVVEKVQVEVVEVDRPDRKARRRQGKSDPLDAIAAALAALSGRASGKPKTRTGSVEAIRVLQTARRGAVKARTAAVNQLHGLIVSAPEQLRAQLITMPKADRVLACAALPVDHGALADPIQATSAALRTLARRVQHLTTEINEANKQLKALIATTAPRLSAVRGVGPDVAARMLAAVGDNPDRLRSEAALAQLCGVAPIPASSGRTDRHRLNRGGDRSANCALHTVVVTRLAHDPPTRAYMERRTKEGKTKKEIIRCLKRYVARELHTAILADFEALNTA
jgi:transposase